MIIMKNWTVTSSSLEFFVESQNKKSSSQLSAFNIFLFKKHHKINTELLFIWKNYAEKKSIIDNNLYYVYQ
jgi:hypothetical protein